MSQHERFANYFRAAKLAAHDFNNPEETTNPALQVTVAQSLADRLGYDMDFSASTAVQARLATIAMLERKEIQQHGRIRTIRMRFGGAK